MLGRMPEIYAEIPSIPPARDAGPARFTKKRHTLFLAVAIVLVAWRLAGLGRLLFAAALAVARAFLGAAVAGLFYAGGGPGGASATVPRGARESAGAG